VLLLCTLFLKKTSHLWLAITWACEQIFTFFGRNVNNKYAIKRHFAVPHQITCASALPVKMGKHKNCIFPSNAVLLHCLNSTSCLISSIFLTYNSYSRCCMTP